MPVPLWTKKNKVQKKLVKFWEGPVTHVFLKFTLTVWS
jgi:hypothetical protein